MNLIRRFSAGALRSPHFDAWFVLGIPALALSAGALVTLRPELFLLVFTVDLWLLGYHHVAATFTRVCFDSESFRTHRSTVLILPVAVAIVVVALIAGVGLWLIATVYLYWQWWHYTRQSEGIEKAYAARNKDADIGDPRLARIVHYAMPIAGILTVSARQPETFVFLPIKTLPVPWELAQLAQAFALLVVVLWMREQWRIWRNGRLAATYSAYMATHLLIYAVAYIGFETATRGWLVINMWHNTQYLAFVWMFNNRRFSSGVDPRHLLLSTLSQTKNWWLYVAACLTLSTAFYYSTSSIISLVGGVSTVAYMAAFYQIINFHHYIVDSKIWKLRRPAVRQNIGIT
jgi:hypothetical protein